MKQATLAAPSPLRNSRSAAAVFTSVYLPRRSSSASVTLRSLPSPHHLLLYRLSPVQNTHITKPQQPPNPFTCHSSHLPLESPNSFNLSHILPPFQGHTTEAAGHLTITLTTFSNDPHPLQHKLHHRNSNSFFSSPSRNQSGILTCIGGSLSPLFRGFLAHPSYLEFPSWLRLRSPRLGALARRPPIPNAAPFRPVSPAPTPRPPLEPPPDSSYQTFGSANSPPPCAHCSTPAVTPLFLRTRGLDPPAPTGAPPTAAWWPPPPFNNERLPSVAAAGEGICRLLKNLTTKSPFGLGLGSQTLGLE
ncbi:hypothetical protein Salat_2617100 [Sesamum alatum]|uniref:Uncharacterized protein n=1 Tax=Sesamum alatum TaxID=300844 RepID=A0AAE2CAJ0_9LAMI|nr:hypothetical protein Salat_2617100 [Sesamum alatum]